MTALLVIIKTIFALIGMYFTGKALFGSVNVSNKMLEDISISYLYTTNRKRFIQQDRISIAGLFIVDLLMFSYGMQRIVMHFPPFISGWVEGSSVLVSLIMLWKSYRWMIAYDIKASDFFNNIFYKNKNPKS